MATAATAAARAAARSYLLGPRRSPHWPAYAVGGDAAGEGGGEGGGAVSPSAAAPVSASCVVAPSGIPYALLVGHTNGEVVQLPLPGGPPRPAVHRASKRHRGVVTDLLALRSASGERACFVSASSAGEVMMWALQSMTPLCSFSQHASGVHTLTMPPAGVPLHMEAWVLAVGDDGAISIYDVAPLLPPPPAASSSSGGACASGRGASGGDDLPRLPSTFDLRNAAVNVHLVVVLAGHAEPVRELTWRAAEHLLVVRCSRRERAADGGGAAAAAGGTSASSAAAPAAAAAASSLASPSPTAAPTGALDLSSILYVWQLPTGRLARVLHGTEALPHLETCAASPLCQPIPPATGPREFRVQTHHAAAAKRLVELVRVGLGDGNAPLQLLIFNVKRLAAEAKKESRTREAQYWSQGSPRVRRHSFRPLPSTTDQPAAAANGESAPDAQQPPPPPPPPAQQGGDAPPAAAEAPAPAASTAAATEGERDRSAIVPYDVAACRSALSFMCCWGVDAAFDRQCEEEIGLRPPPLPITYGVRGHSGNLSFLTPRAQSRHHRWQCSSHLTALHSIAAVALANTRMCSPGNDDVRNVCSSLVTHFSVALPEKLPLFCAPSLSLLARHYADPVEEVQQAARALLEGTIHRMKREVRAQLVAAGRRA